MCCKNLWKGFVPFALAFSISLFINSFLIANNSQNDFTLNIEKPFKKIVVNPSPENQAINILEMPKAEYTNQARENYLVRVIRLKVSFLANSQIGKVEVIDGLRYGLTKSAIRAAKGIKFEPATLNNKPVNTNLIIEYSFAPYGQQIAVINSDFSKRFVWNNEKGTFASEEFELNKIKSRDNNPVELLRR